MILIIKGLGFWETPRRMGPTSNLAAGLGFVFFLVETDGPFFFCFCDRWSVFEDRWSVFEHQLE